MSKIICELCGNDNVLKTDGFFVCQQCGAKYTVEEAKKLISSDSIRNSSDDNQPSIDDTVFDKEKVEEILVNRNNSSEESSVPKSHSILKLGKKKQIAFIAAVAAVLLIIIVFILPNNSKKEKYNTAINYIQNKNYAEAYRLFDEIKNYRDSNELQASIKGDYEAELIRMTQIGDTVIYGTYEQDGDTNNGPEDIEWVVIAQNSSYALLVSKYGLDAVQYDDGRNNNRWEHCILRTWLNDTFYNEAFTKSEKGKIVAVESNNDIGIKANNTVTDKVFVLSSTDVWHWDPSLLICKPTPYAIQQGLEVGGVDNSACRWWTLVGGWASTDRPGIYIDFDGSVSKYEDATHGMKAAARPFIAVDISN